MLPYRTRPAPREQKLSGGIRPSNLNQKFPEVFLAVTAATGRHSRSDPPVIALVDTPSGINDSTTAPATRVGFRIHPWKKLQGQVQNQKYAQIGAPSAVSHHDNDAFWGVEWQALLMN
jgi:hypothetical protein